MALSSKLFLVRGLPGSGKTSFVHDIMSLINTGQIYHFEADNYFYNYNQETGENEYKFNRELLPVAHKWCQDSVREILRRKNKNIIFVSNTFTQMWEMRPYLNMAKEFSVPVTVITCEGNYGNNHGVPEEKIQVMKNRWERFENE